MDNGTYQISTPFIEGLSNVIYNRDDIRNDYIRETNCRFDSSPNPIQNGEKNTETVDYTNEIKVNIFRYKFTDHFTSVLYVFAKVHQYDHRKDFKEAWTIWTEENDDIISEEIKRLEQLGYEGDILEKMFKSARYYFRKKSTEKKAPKERQDYVGINRELLNKIDEHIKMNIYNDDYKPSIAFGSFCNENIQLLQEEVTRLFTFGLKDYILIKNKIKKTYKNRYFIIINNLK